MGKKNSLVVHAKSDVATTLRALADGIESGSISNYEITQKSDGFISVLADSSDGKQRIIKNQKNINGLQRESSEHIRKLVPNERRELVRELHIEGMTQSEIAKRTMTSQKTISNDIKILREEEEI